MASKKFFSRAGTSKRTIAADGLLELLAKGEHKLFTNCYELFTVFFKPLGDYQPIVFCFVCFFKNTIKITSVLVYSYGPVELMEECF